MAGECTGARPGEGRSKRPAWEDPRRSGEKQAGAGVKRKPVPG